MLTSPGILWGLAVQAQGKIVSQVFEDFIAKLRADEKFDQGATERLRATLLDRNETEQDLLEKALFSEDGVE